MGNRDVYTALEVSKREIRVLELYAGLDDEHLKASISTISLLPPNIPRAGASGTGTVRPHQTEDTPQGCGYEAISYCWGDERTTVERVVNKKPFMAPSSAVEVLHRFRSVNTSRFLWIDALYINQDDIDERSQQVLLMGDIYRNAHRSLVWFGPNYNDALTCRAIEAMKKITRTLDGLDMSSMEYEKRVEGLKDAIRDPYGELKAIYERHWFGRLWVWQEAILPPQCSFYLGSYEISWDELKNTSQWLVRCDDGLQNLTTSEYNQMCAFVNTSAGIFQIAPRVSKLLPLFTVSCSARTSEPRDQVYALLGILPAHAQGHLLPPGLRPDYRMSVKDCMRNATRAIIETDGDLLVFTQDRINGKHESQDDKDPFPSWSPVWCATKVTTSPISWNHNVCADNGQGLIIDESEDADELHVRGYHAGKACLKLMLVRQIFQPFKKGLATIFSMLQAIASEMPWLNLTPTSSKLFLSVVRALVGEYHENERIDQNHERLMALNDCLRGIGAQCWVHEEIWSMGKSIVNEISKTCPGRFLFVTEDGQFGLGPDAMKSGDDVFVLFGSQMPCLLRREGDHYHVVSVCFLLDVMHGELLYEREKQGILPERIILR